MGELENEYRHLGAVVEQDVTLVVSIKHGTTKSQAKSVVEAAKVTLEAIGAVEVAATHGL